VDQFDVKLVPRFATREDVKLEESQGKCDGMAEEEHAQQAPYILLVSITIVFFDLMSRFCSV